VGAQRIGTAHLFPHRQDLDKGLLSEPEIEFRKLMLVGGSGPQLTVVSKKAIAAPAKAMGRNTGFLGMCC
jgi:hypothetical protein